MIAALATWAALQDPGVDELLRQLAHETIEVRDQAAARLVERWKQWTASDLKKIEAAAGGADAETSGRARAVLEEIALRRRIPDSACKAAPGLAATLSGGTPDAVADLIDQLQKLVDQGKLVQRDIVPVLIEVLDDDRRTTRRREIVFDRDDPCFTVGEFARHALFPVVWKSALDGRAAWRAWWQINGDKPAKDWYLPDLAHDSEDVRVEAIGRLAQLKDLTLYPDLFDALAKVRGGLAVASAIAALRPLPPNVLGSGLKPYLGDKRPYARLEAARLVYSTAPRESVDAVVESVEFPERMEMRDIDPEIFRAGYRTVEWLASTEHERAYVFLFRALKTGPSRLKQEVLMRIADRGAPGVMEAFVEALDDRSDEEGGRMRFCDEAAERLAWRLQMERLDWICSRRLRDLNILRVRNAWRATKGVAPLPVPAADLAPVAEEKLRSLLPDLVGEDKERRAKGIRELAALGPGAWAHLQRAKNGSQGNAVERLREAALAVANTLRRVDGVDEAPALDEEVRGCRDRPFDVAALERLGAAWLRDQSFSELDAELERNRDGQGIFVTLRVKKGGPGRAPSGLGFWTLESVGSGRFGEDVFDSEWKELFLHPFREAIRAEPDQYVYRWIRLQKRWK